MSIENKEIQSPAQKLEAIKKAAPIGERYRRFQVWRNELLDQQKKSPDEAKEAKIWLDAISVEAVKELKSNTELEAYHFAETGVMKRNDAYFQAENSNLWLATFHRDPQIFQYFLSARDSKNIASAERVILFTPWESKRKREILTVMKAKGYPLLAHFEAAALGDLDELEKLEKKDPTILMRVDEQGRNAMHYAAANGQVEVMKFLWEKIGKKLLKLEDSYTAFSYAIMNGQIKAAEFLATVNPDYCQPLAPKKGGKMKTSYALAVEFNQLEMLQWLFAAESESFKPTGEWSLAISGSVVLNRIEILDWLLDMVDFDTCWNNRDRMKNLFFHALENGHFDIAFLLLSKKFVNLNARSFEGSSALLWAAHTGNEELAKTLITIFGADPNQKISNKGTFHSVVAENKNILPGSVLRNVDAINKIHKTYLSQQFVEKTLAEAEVMAADPQDIVLGYLGFTRNRDLILPLENFVHTCEIEWEKFKEKKVESSSAQQALGKSKLTLNNVVRRGVALVSNAVESYKNRNVRNFPELVRLGKELLRNIFKKTPSIIRAEVETFLKQNQSKINDKEFLGVLQGIMNQTNYLTPKTATNSEVVVPETKSSSVLAGAEQQATLFDLYKTFPANSEGEFIVEMKSAPPISNLTMADFARILPLPGAPRTVIGPNDLLVVAPLESVTPAHQVCDNPTSGINQ